MSHVALSDLEPHDNNDDDDCKVRVCVVHMKEARCFAALEDR